MLLPLSEFEWEVPADGFAVALAPGASIEDREAMVLGTTTRAEWRSPDFDNLNDDGTWKPGHDQLSRVLIPRSPAPPKSYKPLLEQPGLFRRFAELDDSLDAFIEFINDFGPLFHPSEHVLPPWHPETTVQLPKNYFEVSPGSDPLVLGTPLLWHYKDQFEAVIALHGAIASGDTAAIEALVSWSGTTAWFDMDGIPGNPRHHDTPRIEGADQDRPMEVAAALRDQGISRAFGGETSDPLEDDLAHPDSLVSLEMSGGEPRIVPMNLLGAMWLQVAMAVAENKEFRKCPARNCPVVWFEVSTGPLGVRDDAGFCSARCRHTAYRDRKNRARQMHRDGVALPQIAKTLETDAVRVRNWIGTRKR